MKQIFLISGYAESGKDSTAKILKDNLTGNSLVLHFADYLKYIAKEYMGWNGLKDIEGRTLLQKLGTEKVRMQLKWPLYWVERVCDIIQILEGDYDYFLIPDLRYINELHYPIAIFPNKVTSIRVKRLNFENDLTPEQRNHISETELENYSHDYYIQSPSGLDHLEKEVKSFIYSYYHM